MFSMLAQLRIMKESNLASRNWQPSDQAVWKVLGTIALLVPRFPRLKEWAYAGIFFNMTGAAVSHAVSGDASWHVIYTACLAVLTIASWALRPPSRTLGVLFPFQARISQSTGE
jgi:hypothetical protein